MDNFNNFFDTKLAELDHEADLFSYIDLSIASNQQKLGFQNAVQQYVQLEEFMKGGFCNGNCVDIQDKYVKFAWFNNNVCQGTLRNCRYTKFEGYVVYSVKIPIIK